MLKNLVEYILFILLAKFFTLFKIKSSVTFGKILGTFLFYVIPIRKKVVVENLKIAFPDYDETQIKKIARANYISFAITLIEMFHIPKLKKEALHNYVLCKDLDLIKEKHNAGKGVVLLTAHFGNWEIGAVSVGSQLGIPIHTLAKPQRNKYVSRWLDKMRASFGNKVILLGVSVRELYKTILQGGIIGIVGDQRGPETSIRVKFFNQNTAVYTGTAEIAVKNRTPILVVLVVRSEDCLYEAVVQEIRVDYDNLSKEESVEFINQSYVNILEKTVIRYPDQWFWMHKIWKY